MNLSLHAICFLSINIIVFPYKKHILIAFLLACVILDNVVHFIHRHTTFLPSFRTIVIALDKANGFPERESTYAYSIQA